MSKTIRKRLDEASPINEGKLDPRKALCNNCGSEITYNLLKHPAAAILTLTDTLGGEVFYCPNCGPIDAESLDGVSVE